MEAICGWFKNNETTRNNMEKSSENADRIFVLFSFDSCVVITHTVEMNPDRTEIHFYEC